MQQPKGRRGLEVVRGDAPAPASLSDVEAARRIDAVWREAFIAMCDDLPRRPHQAFYHLANPSSGRRPWFGVTRNADRAQAGGVSVDAIERELQRAVTEMCAVMRRRDRRHWQVDDTPRVA